ncbi:MAG: NAD(P)/FAD-dependent oxidoreductase [Pseudomonadota bacterium]
MTDDKKTIIVGGGPAGLTAAWDLKEAGVPTSVYEKDEIVGGISRTVNYNGYRFDIGGHRFFTKVKRVDDWWWKQLSDEFLVRPRLSRIYYNDKFFDYPLKPMNALMGLGIFQSIAIMISYAKAQLFPSKPEENLEQWVSNRFGTRLYQIFFKTYTEKVWGIPCTEIAADWAAQRIKNLDLKTAVKNAFFGDSAKSKGEVVTTLIEQFHYPRLGPGMMWERVAERLDEAGYPVKMNQNVTTLHHDGSRITSITAEQADGTAVTEEGAEFLSTMPIRELINALEPKPPQEILDAANNLNYRDFLTVGLVLKADDPFPDNWIYIHSSDVKVGRIQNFKAWSPYMVADPNTSCIGLEYFVQENDELWDSEDDDLIKLGTEETERLGLIKKDDVIDGCVIRMPKAYPVYDKVYQDALNTIRAYLERFPNLQLIGRNGQHRYNNQDHSMMTAMLAAENILGASHDVWDVNVDQEYHEEVQEESQTDITHKDRGGDRLVPQRLEVDYVMRAIEEAYARYDAKALGAALGVIIGVGLFLATAILLIQGGQNVGANLSLLGNYFVGFDVSWPGAFIGLIEGGIFGFVFGYVLAKAINATIGFHERSLIRRLELAATIDAVGQERK